MKARLPLLAALAAAFLPAKASAQAWVSNPDFSEGIGLRAGNLEWHPSLGAEFGYDSNFFRSAEGEGRGVVDVFKLRVTPSFTLGTLGQSRRNTTTPPDVIFTAGAYASYNEIFPVDSENADASQQRNVGVGADAKLNIFPKRKVGFDLLAAYLRAIDTDGTSEDLAGDGFNRNTLRGGAGVTWRPGGGLFEWRAGYAATYNFFVGDRFDSLANVSHDISTRGRWRFLPRSALLFDAGYTMVRYVDAESQQTDGDAARARIGFHGLVTYHLALLGMLGWGASFYEPRDVSFEPQQFDSLVANAEARWFIQARPDLDTATVATGLSSVALGYTRAFSNSYYGSFYQSDRGYLQFSMFLLGAVVGGIEFGVTRLAYPEVVLGNTFQQDSFTQARLDGRIFGEYRFTETLAANATVQYDQVNSGAVVNGEDLDYRRWQAYLGVRWFM
jgi:hypothetical protein